MKTPDPEVVASVRRWLSFAEEDLNLASRALGFGNDRPDRLIAYHAQQGAEKCLKGFLVHCGVDFPYTHNIRVLLKLCREHASWADSLREAEELTAYAITMRYPGEDREVTQEEAQRAVELAQRVSAQVRAALRELGVV